MDRRSFIGKTAAAIAGFATTSLANSPLFANESNQNNTRNMKKIMIIDGGPRRNMNTAAMVEKFAEGARAGGAEVKVVRLYDIDYKGCRTCMACQLKGKRVDSCQYKDGLTDILAECAASDGLVIASPIYYGEITAMARAYWERLTFPWLSYANGSFSAPKKMPVTFIYTMNGMPENGEDVRKQTMRNVEFMTGLALGHEVEVIQANNTTQVNNYAIFDFADGTAEAKKRWRDEHWEQDLQKAYDAGKRMAE